MVTRKCGCQLHEDAVLHHPRWLLAATITVLLGACSPSPQSPASAATSPDSEAAAARTPVAGSTVQAETWELPEEALNRATLESRFGAGNIREESRAGPEGEPASYPVLVLFPDEPSQRLELVVNSGRPDAAFPVIRVSEPSSRWHDATGLRTGMSLDELVALNGAPVTFYGLGWDYGGTVADWHGGRLGSDEGAKRVRSVILAAREGADAQALPTGDSQFRSDDAGWPKAGKDLQVSEVGIRWP